MNIPIIYINYPNKNTHRPNQVNKLHGKQKKATHGWTKTMKSEVF
jgi:hypothetical protein